MDNSDFRSEGCSERNFQKFRKNWNSVGILSCIFRSGFRKNYDFFVNYEKYFRKRCSGPEVLCLSVRHVLPIWHQNSGVCRLLHGSTAALGTKDQDSTKTQNWSTWYVAMVHKIIMINRMAKELSTQQTK